MNDIESQVAEARPSATVLLVRDSIAGPEVLMVERSKHVAFGATFAFPGGVLEVIDAKVHDYCHGLAGFEANECLAVDSGGLDYYSAAAREVFEETGVLLVRDAAGKWAFDGKANALESLAELRAQLLSGDLDWQTLLEQHSFFVAANALHYVNFWETPTIRPKRFATRFFIAPLPPGQETLHDGSEIVDCRWLAPAAALALGESGDIKLPFPTIHSLQQLAAFNNCMDLLEWAGKRNAEPTVRILPVVIRDGDSYRITMPGDPDYPGEDAL